MSLARARQLSMKKRLSLAADPKTAVMLTKLKGLIASADKLQMSVSGAASFVADTPGNVTDLKKAGALIGQASDLISEVLRDLS